MSGATQTRGADLLSEESRTTIDAWLTRFPAGQKQSAVLAALQAAQEQNGGWVTRERMPARMWNPSRR